MLVNRSEAYANRELAQSAPIIGRTFADPAPVRAPAPVQRSAARGALVSLVTLCAACVAAFFVIL